MHAVHEDLSVGCNHDGSKASLLKSLASKFPPNKPPPKSVPNTATDSFALFHLFDFIYPLEIRAISRVSR